MDGPPPQEEDFSTVPISERLTHKNWKARVSAYESLTKTFQVTASDSDPAFRPYLNNNDLLKKIVTDANAVAQERGIECIVSLVKFAGENAAKTREAVVPSLVDKCIGSSRAGTRTHATELILEYVSVENGASGVVSDIIPGLGAKQPKTVLGCVTALKEIVRLFGIQAAPPPQILKALPKIYAHTDKSVRAEGTALTQILYRYLGSSIESWLGDLKPVQIKELKELFESMEADGTGKGTIKPERLTRAQEREAGSNVGTDGGEPVIEEAEPEPLDPRAFAEPVDVVPRIPSSFQTALGSSKWKERKEVLDDLLTVLQSTPRIKEASELGEVAKQLAIRVQTDANINCVIVAANCLEGLARGLMSSFSRYRETTLPLLLERLKERKVNVTDAIGSAMDAIFASTSLADVIPDLNPALLSKNPQAKEGTLKFLARCLSTSTSPIQPAQIKPLAESLITLLEDPYEGARNEAATCLGTLMKMVGERPLNALIDSLPDVRKAKIKDAYEKATVKSKVAGTGPTPKPGAAPSAKPPTKPPPVAKKRPTEPNATETAKPPSPPPAKKANPPQPKKPPAAIAPPAPAPKKAPATGPKSVKPAATTSGALDAFKYRHTPEDAEALAAELIPSSLLTDFADANWKTRIASLEAMETWLDPILATVDSEVLIRALGKKGWSEKNFQVSAKLYSICCKLANGSPSFGRSCVALCVPHLTEKLGDLKLKKPAGDSLIVFAEKTSLQFVLSQAYEPLEKQKAPKVIADALAWMNTCLVEFGIQGLTLRRLIDFLKSALQNSNAAVRTNATKTLVTVKLFAGSGVKDLIEDLNPQLLNTISSEFDKVEGTPAPIPTRTQADVSQVTSSTNVEVAGGDPLDDLFPRVELDGLFKGTTILVDAKAEQWKTKKEALETLQGILDQGSNKRLKPGMGEIGQILKVRVVDTNKVVQALALDIVTRIATGMGKPFEKQCRLLVGPIASVLSDQKATVRSAALQTLTSIARSCEALDPLLPSLISAMESPNPQQKAALLHWFNEWLTDNPASSSLDLSHLVMPIVSSLDDRNVDVRKGAQAMLPHLITYSGFDYVLQQANSLKPASRNGAVALIQAVQPSATSTAPVSHKPSPTPAVVSDKSPPPPSPPPNVAPSQKAGNKLLAMRRKLPQSRPESRSEPGVEALPDNKPVATSRRPGGPALSSKAVPEDTHQASALPLLGTNLESRRARLSKDASKWINESGPTRKDLAELLQSQMETHASKELLANLFSHDHNAINDHISGLGVLQDLYLKAAVGDEQQTVSICLANFDFPLKYVSIKAHEPQSNLISKCLDVAEAVLGFLCHVKYQLTDNEALCFVPTLIYKLGDMREPVRVRVQQLVQTLPKVYPYSRIFQLLLDHGLKSKVAKTRQGTLDELAAILKRSGIGACEPSKAFPVVASMISDKDSQVRKSALTVLSEAYSLVGEKIWTFVGSLPAKDKTQLEERLRRVPGPNPSGTEKPLTTQASRLAQGLTRPASPATMSRAGLPRPASPSVSVVSKLARPTSRPASPSLPPAAARSHSPHPSSTTTSISHLPTPASPTGIARPKSLLPSRLARPKQLSQPTSVLSQDVGRPRVQAAPADPILPSSDAQDGPDRETSRADTHEDITITISSILSSDPARSVDALKKVQKTLAIQPAEGTSSPQYQELAEHTEGLVETITLQLAHVFERPDDLISDENFRLAKHLIQTLNNFCDHPFLAESLTVDILTSLLEELTLRLLQTDESTVKKVKDLSRFINMIILRLFATARRMSIFRALFNLLLQIVKPFPTNGTLADSREAKAAELVLKCVWKLARSIPQDLAEQKLDAVELFPSIENFLQSVPPNEWRARATNKVPCGDMPLRTIKVIIQHVVAHYGDDVYDLLSAAFDDPSATIVYPYVYRILNSSSKGLDMNNAISNGIPRPLSEVSTRAPSPHDTVSVGKSSATTRRSSPIPQSPSPVPRENPAEEEDPDARLLTIIGHISSETTGALHKEGITQLHHFLKAYPHKRPRVEKLLDSTGAAFRKYINRALASRAAEEQEKAEERELAVADTLSKLESNHADQVVPEASPRSPQRASARDSGDTQEKLSRLHDLFQYRSSTMSNGSSQDRRSRTSLH